MTPDLEDSLERLEGDPPGWHVRETTETGYPLMGSSPAERIESVERAARIKGQAMRDHVFIGDGPYCEARISTRPQGSPEVGTITGWVGCGYPRDTHPEVAE
jgi:hypothetical protein